ncbi:MAG: 30S ribosomal protein S6 [Candidatus Omnitrophota bacterium]
MKRYEAMVIIRPDLSEDGKNVLLGQLSDAVTKNGGNVSQSALWAEKRKLFFPMKKYREGIYYLISFTSPAAAVTKINHAYNLNEDILRVLFTVLE